MVLWIPGWNIKIKKEEFLLTVGISLSLVSFMALAGSVLVAAEAGLGFSGASDPPPPDGKTKKYF